MNAPVQTSKGPLYCGPAAISAITGKTVEELGLQKVTSMHDNYVTSVLREHGFKTRGVVFMKKSFERTRQDPWWHEWTHNEVVFNGPTIAAFLRDRTPEQRRSMMLITAAHHYVLVERDWLVDNNYPNGIDIADYPYRRRRVVSAMIIERRKQ